MVDLEGVQMNAAMGSLPRVGGLVPGRWWRNSDERGVLDGVECGGWHWCDDAEGPRRGIALSRISVLARIYAPIGQGFFGGAMLIGGWRAVR